VRVAGTTGKARAPSLRFGIGWTFMAVLLRAIFGLILLSVVAYIVTPHASQSQSKLILTKAPMVSDPSRGEEDEDADTAAALTNEESEIGIGSDFDLTDNRRLSADPRPVLQMKSHRGGYLRAQVYDVYTGSSWIKSPRLDPDKGGEGTLFALAPTPAPDISFGLQPRGESYSAMAVRLFDFPSETVAKELANTQGILIPSDPKKTREVNVYSINDESDLDYDIVREEIKLLEPQPPFYFSMYQPFRLENISEIKGGGRFDVPLVDRASTLRPTSLDILHPGNFTYTVYSLRTTAKASQLESVYERGKPEIVERYTQLPWEDKYDPEIHGKYGITKKEYRQVSRHLKNFAGQFALPAPGADPNKPPSVYDEVMAIYNHLLDEKSGYRYSRQFKPVAKDAEITEAFLFGTREGYCRYFASAMAVLCRINGIPARVVSGYSPGTFSWIDNAYVYKASNAHSWVEVYFDGYGWIMFDPSPASAGPYGGGDAQRVIGGIVDFLQDLFVIDPAGTRQVIISAFAALWRIAREHGAFSLLVSAGLAALILLVLLLRTLYRGPHRQRLVPENSIVEMYLALGRQLARLGLKQAPGQTARGFLNEVAVKHNELAAPFSQLAPVYERAAYSGAQPDEADLQVAADALNRTSELVKRESGQRKQAP
jgi:hypothetical protein